MFQKVNNWLADKGERFARTGDANRMAGAYYASQEAEQAYQSARNSGTDSPTPPDSRAAGAETGRSTPADRFSGDTDDKYGGRVPYRSQKDIQAEAEAQRQQMEDQLRRQQTAAQRPPVQPMNRVPATPQQAGYAQAPQGGNIVQFPGMIRGPEGNLYAHVEYVVLLRSRNECTKVIEYIKANASVFLNMEFIANDSERQRCVDMLSGAAYTLGCHLNKISQRGIYLISSPSVCVVIDPAMQKFASAPEAQGYVRPEYSAYGGYAAQQASAYQTPSGVGYATQPGYGAQPAGAYADAGVSAYAAAPATGRAGYGARTAAYGGSGMRMGYAAPSGTQVNGYAATQPETQPGGYVPSRAGARVGGYAATPSAEQTGSFAAQSGAQTGGYAAVQPGARTGGYAAQPGTQTGGYAAAQPGARTGGYAAQRGAQSGNFAAQPGAQTGGYAAVQPGSYSPSAGSGAGGRVSAFASRQGSGAPDGAAAQAAQNRRPLTSFGMQGAFSKSAEGAQGR